jgi:tRNA (guanine-N7-)-methyltransferase
MKQESDLHVPLTHPDYRYPTSRNPYWGKLQKHQGLVYSDNETEMHRGEWRSKFLTPNLEKSRQPLHVEIGCNAGHVILEWAALKPNIKFIGIDWKFKPIFRGVEKGVRRDLKNLLFFRSHAERLKYMFGPGEIDQLFLYFPDPWPKTAHWKNRFITAETLRTIAPLMHKNGVFHIKTDHRGYFDWMIENINQVKDVWTPTEISYDLHAGHPDPKSLRIPEVTLFESLFVKDCLPIHSVKLLLN